jgi:hypothetical protein
MLSLMHREGRHAALSLGWIATMAVLWIGITGADDAAGGDFMYSAGPVRLGMAGSAIIMQRATGGNAKTAFHNYVERLKTGEHIMLVLSDLQTDQAPGVVYDLFVNMPRNTPPGDTDRYYVGSINFFEASGHGSEGVQNSEAKDRRRPFLSYDVTEALRGMAKRGNLPESPTVTIIPSGSPFPAAHPIIGRIQLMRSSK